MRSRIRKSKKIRGGGCGSSNSYQPYQETPTRNGIQRFKKSQQESTRVNKSQQESKRKKESKEKKSQKKKEPKGDSKKGFKKGIRNK